MTVQEAAAELGMSPVGVRARLERGLMRGVKVHPRLWLIPREEVERWRAIGTVRGKRRQQTVGDSSPQAEAQTMGDAGSHDAADTGPVIIGPWEVRQVPAHRGPLGTWFIIDRETAIHEMVCRTKAEAVAWARRRLGPDAPAAGDSGLRS